MFLLQKKDLGLSCRYVVQKAIKPKKFTYRWKKIGYICEECLDAEKEYAFEYGEYNEENKSKD